MLWWCHGTQEEDLASPQKISWPLEVLLCGSGRWRSLWSPLLDEEVLNMSLDPQLVFWWPCNPCLGHGALVWWWWPCMVLDRLWNPWTCPRYDEESHEDLEPLMKTLIPLQRSSIPLLAIYMVRWHDDVVFGDLMKSWNLGKALIPIACTWCS